MDGGWVGLGWCGCWKRGWEVRECKYIYIYDIDIWIYGLFEVLG